MPVVTGKKIPIVTKTVEGVKVEDRDGYYRIVKSYSEATLLVQDLLAHRNSVMGMNGFEASKWKLPKEVQNERNT